MTLVQNNSRALKRNNNIIGTQKHTTHNSPVKWICQSYCVCVLCFPQNEQAANFPNKLEMLENCRVKKLISRTKIQLLCFLCKSRPTHSNGTWQTYARSPRSSIKPFNIEGNVKIFTNQLPAILEICYKVVSVYSISNFISTYEKLSTSQFIAMYILQN